MKTKRTSKRIIGTVIVFLLAVALIAVGVMNNQFQSVMSKATKICLECIGIG